MGIQRVRGVARCRMPHEMLVFRLAHIRFGIDARLVGRVKPLSSFNRIACNGVLMDGVAAINDEAVVLLELSRAMGINGHACIDTAMVILLRAQGRCMGLLVDEVPEIVKLDLCTSLPMVREDGVAVLPSLLLTARLCDAFGPIWLLDIAGWLKECLRPLSTCYVGGE